VRVVLVAPITVMTTWVSLRKTVRNDGRSGRSGRQVKMAARSGDPRRKKRQGPPAAGPHLTSTVRGKKSMPSRTPWAALAVARTVVPPMQATTAPCDWGANLPVSNERVASVPEMAAATLVGVLLA
jgi:hypothetical protein